MKLGDTVINILNDTKGYVDYISSISTNVFVISPCHQTVYIISHSDCAQTKIVLLEFYKEDITV